MLKIDIQNLLLNNSSNQNFKNHKCNMQSYLLKPVDDVHNLLFCFESCALCLYLHIMTRNYNSSCKYYSHNNILFLKNKDICMSLSLSYNLFLPNYSFKAMKLKDIHIHPSFLSQSVMDDKHCPQFLVSFLKSLLFP